MQREGWKEMGKIVVLEPSAVFSECSTIMVKTAWLRLLSRFMLVDAAAQLTATMVRGMALVLLVGGEPEQECVGDIFKTDHER